MKHDFKTLRKGDFDSITIFTPDGREIEGRFTNARISRETIPNGLYAYDLREGDTGEFCSIEEYVAVNHGGTIILNEPLDFAEKDHIILNDAPDSYAMLIS